jgi:hypothetical protein
MISPIAYANFSQSPQLLPDIWVLSPPNTIHAELGHVIPGHLALFDDPRYVQILRANATFRTHRFPR